MKEEARKINERVKSLKRREELYTSYISVMNDNNTKKTLKELYRAPKIASKIRNLGVLMFWIPEPTMISDLVAIPMIASGKLLERYYNDLSIKDIRDEELKVFSTLKDLKDNLKLF
ncbi:MAG: hypothetical protein QW416_02530 [Candidatus Nitrosocaldaceae archaeon]